MAKIVTKHGIYQSTEDVLRQEKEASDKFVDECLNQMMVEVRLSNKKTIRAPLQTIQVAEALSRVLFLDMPFGGIFKMLWKKVLLLFKK